MELLLQKWLLPAVGGQLSGGQLSRYLLSALIELLFISGPVSFSKFVVHQGRSKGPP